MKLLFSLFIFVTLCGCSSVYLERNSNTTFDTLFFGTVISKTNTSLDVNELATTRLANRAFAGGQWDSLGRRDSKFEEPSGFFYSVKTAEGEMQKVLSPSVVEIGSCVEVISIDESEVEILRVSPPEKCA
ncbi:hypothetical protein GQF03_07820 [Sneathiella chungangensis]|uniref:Lipoprotein n=1 Tax=Sneathiella chungangensis TaxID=1418234 RepID=A0A845MDU8_9PROT|nr:hypothetical protein [Sneathiella chungangensis]MZR22233.1 hypothetical protein [Sneathiella chungangensis]